MKNYPTLEDIRPLVELTDDNFVIIKDPVTKQPLKTNKIPPFVQEIDELRKGVEYLQAHASSLEIVVGLAAHEKESDLGPDNYFERLVATSDIFLLEEPNMYKSSISYVNQLSLVGRSAMPADVQEWLKSNAPFFRRVFRATYASRKVFDCHDVNDALFDLFPEDVSKLLKNMLKYLLTSNERLETGTGLEGDYRYSFFCTHLAGGIYYREWLWAANLGNILARNMARYKHLRLGLWGPKHPIKIFMLSGAAHYGVVKKFRKLGIRRVTPVFLVKQDAINPFKRLAAIENKLPVDMTKAAAESERVTSILA